MTQTSQKSQLSIIFFTVFIYLVGFGIILPIIPILSRDFGATATESGFLMAIFSLMQFLFAPLWGKLSDRWGRRPILLFCLFCESLSYIYFSQPRDHPTLFLARGLAGFFGASLSTASAAISDITSNQERSKGMALIGAAFGLGFVFGPALGGGLAAWSESFSTAPHFKTTFSSLAVALICMITFVFGFFRFKETHLHRSREKSSPKVSRWKRIFENLQVETLGQLMLIFFFVSLAMSTMEATLILYMAEKFQWGIKEVSWGFLYIGLIMVFTQGFLVRRLLPKKGERKVLQWGLILFALGLAGIPISSHLSVLAVAMTLLALGNGFCNPSLLGSISLLTSSQEQGEKLGLTQSLSSLGRILGPPMGGFIFGHWFIQAPFYISASFAFIGFGIFWKIQREIPEHGRTERLNP